MNYTTTAATAAMAVLAALGMTFTAQAADIPSSVLALLNRVPELPATAQDATRWVDKRGALVHPGLLALQADIQAHQQAIRQLGAAAGERARAQSARNVEDLGKGLAEIGIDIARMQRDPAYAQQMQARIGAMSPQEMMAMSQRMSQAMNADRLRPNAAQALVDDAPAVRAAAEAGEAYSRALGARMEAREAIWRDAEAAAARIRRTPLTLPMDRPGIEWENIGCDTGCRAQWDAYAGKMLPLMIERDTEILRVRRVALQRQRATAADDLKAADRHLAAAQYGAAAHSELNRSRIVGYDGAAIAELQQLMARVTDAVTSAAAVANCGPQIVLAPGAVCR